MNHFAKPRFFSKVCRRYGEVLLGASQPLLDTVIEELASVRIWFHEKQVLWRLLCAVPSLKQIGEGILEQCRKSTGPWSSVTEKLLYLLYKEHRMSFLWDLLAYLEDRKQEIENVYVTTAVVLPEHVISWFVEWFKVHHHVNVRIHQFMNVDLILGSMIIWRNILIDFSLAPKLRIIERTMAKDLNFELPKSFF
ncbi:MULTISPECIES: F0F1 ATP synthase subunit delta [Holospora]|uniref:F0F1 ATP synthase subunit delta n=2 Tax=Holospora TaxID=44747 RepID=A0A061JG97_9PROT|nr:MULTISPECIES: F0F1 ATP synthase subunit delta [Holospora]ETZ04920.1 F0F1 ATP synthase subunit delta [Holospora undulata HU1]GAJ45881.1 F0F1 ATP synthase subunit delta [Holospora elegans E1]